MTTALDIALDYIGRGWNPVPNRGKEPIGSEWQKRIINAENARHHFNGSRINIGVMLGATSNNLTDVDLDCAEAIAIAPYLLPRTGAIFGRASKRSSHRLYISDLATKTDTAAFQFPDPQPNNNTMLLELRVGANGKGAQTVFPGSTHEESGEPVTWEEDGTPATVAGDNLLRRVRALAAYCLIARYWPSTGSRHRAALVIGGLLARTGRSKAAVKTIVEATAKAAGDEEWRDRCKAAEDAVVAQAQGKKHLRPARPGRIAGRQDRQQGRRVARLRRSCRRGQHRAAGTVPAGTHRAGRIRRRLGAEIRRPPCRRAALRCRLEQVAALGERMLAARRHAGRVRPRQDAVPHGGDQNQ